MSLGLKTFIFRFGVQRYGVFTYINGWCFMVNVGKNITCTRPMDPMGFEQKTWIFDKETLPWWLSEER